ncbi:HTH domain-containing protein [Clostridium sp. 19966]|uniref:HTH domain-containing protein n=1 Tax=Clostridium sp. 19966 TaxID=2768166 RepID=UPI0028DFC0A4|nr:HTH domain-containing protein [Clostridium sp. 19966]MDT8719672.1 HTH domain-containing protein [Clostridium sp. 19966]
MIEKIEIKIIIIILSHENEIITLERLADELNYSISTIKRGIQNIKNQYPGFIKAYRGRKGGYGI